MTHKIRITIILIFLAILGSIMTALIIKFKPFSHQTLNPDLGKTSQEIQAKLGKPLKVVQENSLDVFFYDAIAPSRANLYYFDHDQVVLIVSQVKSGETLQSNIDRYHSPQKTIAYSSDYAQDSHQTAVHIWADRGIALFTYSLDVESDVVRKQEFKPISLDEYLNTWGKDLKEHQALVITGGQSLAAASLTPARIFQTVTSDKRVWLGLIVVLLIITSVITFLTKRRKTYQPPTQINAIRPPENPPLAS